MVVVGRKACDVASSDKRPDLGRRGPLGPNVGISRINLLRILCPRGSVGFSANLVPALGGSIPTQCNFYFSFNIIVTTLQILLIVHLILSMIIYLYSNVRMIGNIFHGSIWNPDGNSIWNDGIHMESISFQVDSIWNGITKMAGISAKTYSIWNGWNPSGMTWIPYGFHVECGGTVKTSLNEADSGKIGVFFERRSRRLITRFNSVFGFVT